MTTSNWDADIRCVFPDWLTKAATERWPAVRESITVGQTVQGNVISRAPFGVWLDIGVGHPALLLVVNMNGAKLRRITFEDYPEKHSTVVARINALGNNCEIGLTQHYSDTMVEGDAAK